VIVSTERLTLSQLEDADAPFILELLMSPGFIDYIGDRGVRDQDGARQYIARQREGYAENGYGLWRADLTATGESAGICGLVLREGLEHPDVGYAFLERFWGRGLASEGAAATLDYARDVLKLPTVVAITKPENEGSIAVLKRIGMRYVGLIDLPGHDGASTYFTT
jgi:ribosomal-protein-alanine N-acetyltransferase